MRFQYAIVRPPGKSFLQGITPSAEGPPDLRKALAQHAAYCQALERCGLKVTVLPADERYPDSTFVEDVAVIAQGVAVATRPGAESRQGEVASMREVLQSLDFAVDDIAAPGTVEGGDICQAEQHFLIGLSSRTNEEGAWQFARFVGQQGFTSSLVDIRNSSTLLHLKTGMTFLGDNRFLVAPGVELSGDFERVPVSREEAYAANCVRVNEFVLAPVGYPQVAATLSGLGYRVLPLDVSEFRKMDGGLSCLSLRF